MPATSVIIYVCTQGPHIQTHTCIYTFRENSFYFLHCKSFHSIFPFRKFIYDRPILLTEEVLFQTESQQSFSVVKASHPSAANIPTPAHSIIAKISAKSKQYTLTLIHSLPQAVCCGPKQKTKNKQAKQIDKTKNLIKALNFEIILENKFFPSLRSVFSPAIC